MPTFWIFKEVVLLHRGKEVEPVFLSKKNVQTLTRMSEKLNLSPEDTPLLPFM
jgi:hypothetical protein